MLPRALPWANFLLGFQPVFAAGKPFVQDKTIEFQANKAAEIIFFIVATEVHGTTRTCREISEKVFSLLKIIILLNLLSIRRKPAFIGFPAMKNSFLLFYSLLKIFSLLKTKNIQC